MSVTNFPRRRKQSAVGSSPPSTRLIVTRGIEMTDEADRVLTLPAGENLRVGKTNQQASQG